MKKLTYNEAIILYSFKWSESSKIIHFFTKEEGMIHCIARSAFSSKSKFRGQTESLQFVQLIVDCKENRELQYLSDITLLNDYSPIASNYTKLKYVSVASEILDKSLHIHDSHPNLFSDFKRFLAYNLTCDEPYSEIAFFKFFLILLDEFGYSIDFEICNKCSKKLDKQYQYDKRFGILCENCLDPLLPNYLNPDFFRFLKRINSIDYNEFSLNNIPKINTWILMTLLLEFYFYHIGYTLKLKSLELF